jgi:hypothetical protein
MGNHHTSYSTKSLGTFESRWRLQKVQGDPFRAGKKADSARHNMMRWQVNGQE